MAATAGQAHALVVNYATELVASFGVADSLGEYLRFPVFVQSLSPAGAKEQLALRRKLPADVKTYITEFESSLDERVTESERYDYRVLLVQVKGSKTEADAAVTFVRAEDLTEERLKQMEAEGKVGAGVIVEKQRDAGHQHKGVSRCVTDDGARVEGDANARDAPVLHVAPVEPVLLVKHRSPSHTSNDRPLPSANM